MAVNFARAAPTDICPPPHANFYHGNNSNRTTPISSPEGTPTNISPTSPRNTQSAHGAQPLPKQLYPPKLPLFMPAVLRPTKTPARFTQKRSRDSTGTSPPTPPQSAGSSIDENASSSIISSSESSDGIPRRVLGDGPLPPQVTRIITDEWNEELGPMTGVATREHWRPDSSSMSCNASGCAQPFGTFVRRHHCRRCGNIFCGAHSNHQIPLDQHARFHDQGYQERGCDTCWSDFRCWRSKRKQWLVESGRGSISSGDGSSFSSGSGTATPMGIVKSRLDCNDSRPTTSSDTSSQHQPGSELATTFRDNHDWSTF